MSLIVALRIPRKPLAPSLKAQRDQVLYTCYHAANCYKLDISVSQETLNSLPVLHSGRKLAVLYVSRTPHNLKKFSLVNGVELLYHSLPAGEATNLKSICDEILRQVNALHCASTGHYMSSICNKTALHFQENNNLSLKSQKKIQENSSWKSSVQ